jgi:glycosyltransferase involved in cell wall biosynthesis
MPYFSVITPSWNQGRFLKTCIESVVAQGDSDFEHLIFDNVSTDESAAIAKGFSHVRFVSERDRGQSHAVNKGFLKASGEIVCWLNSDDAYPAGVFPILRERFADSSVDVIFGHVRQVSYAGGEEQIAEAKFDRREDFIRWWSREVKLHQPAVFFRKSVQDAIGLLREDLHLVMDYEYWWRMSERYRFHMVPEVLAVQHRQLESKTVRDWAGVYAERERIFSPFYGMIDGGDRAALMRQKRVAMCERYLEEAYACVGSHPLDAWQSLVRSFRERPASVFGMRWVGLVRRFLAGWRLRAS